MRVSQEWLGEFVSFDEGHTPSQIAELLTESGTEVERIIEFGRGLDQVVVAEVVELARMEGSDHLWLTKVRVPGEEPLSVVCGAPNLSLGAVVAWARAALRPGARPASDPGRAQPGHDLCSG